MNSYIKKIEKYAHENNIPIMLSDGIDYMCHYIEKNNIINILEIGTAIGYSAIKMALVKDNIKVTTIERDKERYDIAINNIKKFGLDNRIKVIYADALDVELDDIYDLIFIDASKGGSIKFFNKFKDNLSDNGTIITDNLSFHGLVDNPSLAITKNQKGLVKRINNFIDFLNSNKEFVTKYIEVGDRISISKKIS
ncbi:MAG: O-methyltransferase [Bacilli bacterium]|nr:O-methyltransferase [Bacilli bacterium]